MERLIIGKCRRRFFLIAMAAFIFWFMLIYLFNADVVVDDGAVVLLTDYPSNTIVDPSQESRQTANAGDDPARAAVKTPEEDLQALSDSILAIQEEVKEPPKEEKKPGDSDDRSKTVPVAEAPKASDVIIQAMEIAVEQPPATTFDKCAGKYVYVMRLPRRFNDDLLRSCRSLSTWTDMCETLSNSGLGPPIPKSERVLGKTGWYSTNQFSLEVIFHNRMKQYKCLTSDYTIASAIFIPYYAGLDVAQYLWHSTEMRDIGPRELVKWLKRRPEWKVMLGKDHFMVAGRIAWDFRRETFLDSDWGTNLLVLPEVKNMTSLVLESTLIKDANDFAIPYPTYFHPSSDEEIIQWQGRMRGLRRRYLFSFAGARRPNLPTSIRDEIIDQCRASKRKCKLLECYSRGNTCYRPFNLMSLFQSSVFCLQPQGDSYTRRSTFDSILAGCIPVFFHRGSAYDQYKWHLPIDHTRYSVFIPEKDVKDKKANIDNILSRIPKRKVEEMRDEVIGLIPKILYADLRSKLETFEDAFDLTVQGVLERIDSIRRGER